MIKFHPFRDTFILLLITASLIACKQNQTTVEVESLEIFKVEGDNQTKKPTELSYKEVKFYDNDGYLSQQHFYSVDNKLKSYEVIKRDGNKAVSNYYDSDSTILAIYHIDLNGKNEVSRKGYDGFTKEHLRSERYTYDASGNRITKEILTTEDVVTRKFAFTYDAHGNQTGHSVMNTRGKVLNEEKYEIVKRDDENKWLEKWGYINGKPRSFHRRKVLK